MKKLELAFLGQPDFKLGNESINDLVLRKGLALIAYLAVTKQAHSREALAGLLWGEMTEEKARRNLRVALTKLRKQFDDFLIIQRRTLAFDPNGDYWLDVELFEKNLNQPNPTTEQLQTAVDLYRGPFLADLPLRDAPLFEEWVRPYQERLRQMAMEALYRLSVANTQQGQYVQGIDNLSKLLKLEPWMEEAHRQLMLLFALSGQRSAALAQFETCQAILDEELGVEPTEATITLYQKILNEEIQADDTQIVPAPPISIPIPFQAPATKSNFIGRSTFLVGLKETVQLSENGTIQALVGMGGVGKSTLAVQLAHQLRPHFVDGVLWANAAVSEPHSVIESWAHLYGYDFSRMIDLESMAAAFRSVLADKSVLIILDDVTSTTRIKPLLPTGVHNHVLLTTRDHDLARALDAQVWLLRELSLANGRILLASILGEERLSNEPEAAIEICNLLENLPLAVEIIGQRLKSRPRRRLTDVARRLRNEEKRLSELRISDRAVRASFAISYQSLDRDLQRMFALMGLFNGRSFSAEALAHVAQLDRYEAEDRIFALTALSLAQEDGQTRYKQHALLADFALEKLEDESDGDEYGRFAHYYLHFAQQNQTNYELLRPEWDNLMDAMKTAYTHRLWQVVIEFANALHDAWFTRGRFTQARQAFAWTYKAIVELEDKKELADNWLRWGYACAEQSDFDEAKELFNSALTTYLQLDEQLRVADVYSNLARIAVDQSEYEEANQFLELSLKIRDERNDAIGLAKDFEMQARVLHRQWQYEEAHKLIHKALNIQQQHVAVNKIGIIQAIRLLIDIELALHAQQHRPLEPLEIYCDQVLDLCHELQDQGELAVTLYSLSRLKLAQGDFEVAKNSALESLSLLEYIGDRRSQAIVLGHIAKIEYQQGKYEVAIEVGTKSLPILQSLGDKTEIAITYHNIGFWYHCIIQDDQAALNWIKALEIAQEIEHKALINKINMSMTKYLAQSN